MLHIVMQQHVCNIKINQKIYRQIYYLIHSTKGEQTLFAFFTYVLFRLCFPCVGDVFLARSGSVLFSRLQKLKLPLSVPEDGSNARQWIVSVLRSTLVSALPTSCL